MAYDTVESAVETMAEHFANWEKWAAKAKKAAREMKAGFVIIRSEGYIGGLDSLAMATELDAMATRHEAEIYDMHAKLTAVAKANGIDLPSIADGGGR
jgi:hypothetical protein